MTHEWNSVVNDPPEIPGLLVSVRNREEAAIAIAGGCDILDLKEPSRGSLGRVDEAIARQIVNEVSEIPVSLALGELSDWQHSASIPFVPSGTSYCKIGLSGQALNPRWKQDWNNFRNRVDEKSAHPQNWIAVVYADSLTADSPCPDEILDAATNTGCKGILFDTFSKTEGNLFGCLEPEELSRLAAQIRSTDLLFAIAGSLRIEQVPQILLVRPDIVGVRGAVCSDHCRTSGIEAERIRELKQVLRQIPTKEIHSR